MLGFVLLFKLFNNCESGVGVEAVARAAEMLANIKAIRLVDVISMFIHPYVHWPFTLADILGSADDAFHKVYDPSALAVDVVENAERFICPVALEFFGSADLPTAFVLPFG